MSLTMRLTPPTLRRREGLDFEGILCAPLLLTLLLLTLK